MANDLRFRATLQDQVGPGLKKIQAETKTTGSGFAAHFGAAGSAVSGLEKRLGPLGGALGHAKTQITGLASGVGMLAGGAGLLGLGGILVSSVNKIEDFGASLEKVQMLTGETALSSGALILQFQKFGIDAAGITKVVGFTEKALGKLNDTTAKGTAVAKSAALMALEQRKLQLEAVGASTKTVDALIKRQKAQDALTGSANASAPSLTKLQSLDAKYGLQLVDSKGKVADFSATLEQLANFYDSNASASTKAYVASQILGRGYTTLLPILKEGSAGIREAADQAKSLGLNSTDTVKQIGQFHDQMHELEQQANLLQLSLGTALLPTLIDVSKGITTFISNNRTGIVGTFKSGVEVARELAHAAGDIFGAIETGWSMVPGPLKTLLITGFAAGKVTKFLFDFGPMDFAKLGAKFAAGFIAPAAAKLGETIAGSAASKAIPQDVFVVNWAMMGGGGGVVGAVEGAAGAAASSGLGILGGMTLSAAVGTIATIALPIAAAYVIANILPSDPSKNAARQPGYATGTPGGVTKTPLVIPAGSMSGGSAITVGVAGRDTDKLGPLPGWTGTGSTATGRDTDRTIKATAKESAAVQKAINNLKPHIDATTAAVKGIRLSAPYQLSKLSTKQRSIETLGGSSSGQHASGTVGLTTGTTSLGVMGEAGTEAYAILKNPKPIPSAALLNAVEGRSIMSGRTPTQENIMATAMRNLARQGASNGGNELTVNVKLSAASGVITPGAARAIMAELGPLMVAWFQRNGILPRLGTPLRG